MEKTKKRDASLDFVCGLLIIHMILGHVNSHCDGMIYPYHWPRYALDFFMAWFFYKGGMMHKDIASIEDLKALIKKSFVRLIIPAFVFGALGYIIWLLNLYLKGNDISILWSLKKPIVDIIKESIVPGNIVIWYLFALFFIRIFFRLFDGNTYQKLSQLF